MIYLTGFVLMVPSLFKKTVTPVLLNALDSTGYYVSNYARDARPRPSKGHPTREHHAKK